MPQLTARLAPYQSQIGFYDFLIHDMFDAWFKFVVCVPSYLKILTKLQTLDEELEVEEATAGDISEILD